MLCSRFKQILLTKSTSNHNVRCRCLSTTNNILKKCWKDSFLASVFRSKVDIIKMSSIRFLLKDLGVTRFWSAWSRNISVSNVVRRCRRDRNVRGMIQCVRQTFLKSRKTLLLSASAAYKLDGEGGEEEPPPCENNITDEDLQKLLSDLETIKVLLKTLYCNKCKDRIVIDKKLPGVKYCTCKEPELPEPSEDGWMPYMEAEDVIIWRKEYKPGQGLFAYKVYGQYKEVLAQHFAAIQVDGGYRRVWDTAVAALSIVERSANGVIDQAVLHWEVLWPRLFANRDYVYIRRHKEFDLSAQKIPTPVPESDQNTAPSDKNTAKTGYNIVATGRVPAIPTTTDENTASTSTEHKTAAKKFRNPNKFHHNMKSRKPDTATPEENTATPKQDTATSEQNTATSEQNTATSGKNTTASGQNTTTSGQNTTLSVQNTATSGQNTATSGQNTTTSGKNTTTSDPNTAAVEKPVKSEKNPVTDTDTVITTGKIPVSTGKKHINRLHERPSVHSNAKRKSEELNKHEDIEEAHGDRAYVIVSRSCVHPEVPETKHAIRVTEYWSHMVVKTLNGADHPGMEFVLTYYDEPAVGGMPPGVASWATGRAAPVFLMNMRKAANNYKEFNSRRRGKDPPDFTPFRPDKVSYDEEAKLRHRQRVSEEDMESSRHGPEMENNDPIEVTREQSTQTECEIITAEKAIGTNVSYSQQETTKKSDDSDESEKSEDDDEKNSSWWRALYPFYYFV